MSIQPIFTMDTQDLINSNLPEEIEKIELGEKCGEGSFGIVYKGLIKYMNNNQIECAIKTIKRDHPYTKNQAWTIEISRLEELNRVLPENSTRLLHVIYAKSENNEYYVFIIQKLYLFSISNLGEYLDKPFENNWINDEIKNFVKVCGENKNIILNLIHELLSSMAIMHEKNFIHKDIKPDNIMFYLDNKNKYHAVISDYGFVDQVSSFATGNKSRSLLVELFGDNRFPNVFCAPEVSYNFGLPAIYPTMDEFSMGATIYTFLYCIFYLVNKKELNDVDKKYSYLLIMQSHKDLLINRYVKIFSSYCGQILPTFYNQLPGFNTFCSTLGLGPNDILNEEKLRKLGCLDNVTLITVDKKLEWMEIKLNSFFNEIISRSIVSVIKRMTMLDPTKRFYGDLFFSNINSLNYKIIAGILANLCGNIDQ